MKHDAYHNARLAEHEDTDACSGTLETDPAKVAWLFPMVIAGTIGSAVTISLSAIVLFVASTVITLCLGHSLGMHRRLIHRSYDCPKWMEYGFVHLGVLVGLGGPFGMLRTHDTRDWAQRQARCHDYYSHDQPWYRDIYWQLFCTMTLHRPAKLTIESAIADDRVYRWMERTWMLQQLPWALLFYAIGGWGWVFWGVCSRVSVSVFGHWLIGYFAHNHGERDWHVQGAAAQGHNVRWCGLITMGEGWHNNHHAFPGSAKLGLYPGQSDPGWWVLRCLERAGLVSNLVLPEGLPERPELISCGEESAPKESRVNLRNSTGGREQRSTTTASV